MAGFDKDGELITRTKFSELRGNVIAQVEQKPDGTVNIINLKGKTILSFSYDSVFDGDGFYFELDS